MPTTSPHTTVRTTLNYDNLTETITEFMPEEMVADDAIFVISNAIIILTMQSGFGLLECGCVSFKSAANIMFKNSVDIIFGTVAFWAYGWGLSFGTPSNAFCSYGQFFFVPSWTPNNPQVGSEYIAFFFQSTFANTATTIVSGSIAERASMHAYVIFSAVNMLTYIFPASWVWGSKGFLSAMGFYDFAGGQVVHANGGFMALYVAWLIGPRMGCFEGGVVPEMSSPVTALSGTFILWFAWFGFNCGTTFSVQGIRWKLAALVANNTLQGSAGGGATAIILSLIINKHYSISWLINGILGGLVAITGNCSIIEPHESLFIGAMGAVFSISACVLVEKIKIDDPVSAFAVHGAAGVWGCIATGIFGHNVITEELSHEGLIYTGSFYLLGVQIMGICLIAMWSVTTSAILLSIINIWFPLRLSHMEEVLGPDIAEHMVKPSAVTFIEGDKAGGMMRLASSMSRPMTASESDTSSSVSRRSTLGSVHIGKDNDEFKHKSSNDIIEVLSPRPITPILHKSILRTSNNQVNHETGAEDNEVPHPNLPPRSEIQVIEPGGNETTEIRHESHINEAEKSPKRKSKKGVQFDSKEPETFPAAEQEKSGPGYYIAYQYPAGAYQQQSEIIFTSNNPFHQQQEKLKKNSVQPKSKKSTSQAWVENEETTDSGQTKY